MSSKKLQVYKGTDLTVTFDPKVCIHAALCVKQLPAVFDVGRRPWVEPDAAGAEEVVAQVDRCPSGALQVVAPVEESG